MNADRRDMMRRILELSGTAREGMAYVERANREGQFENAFHVLADVVDAFAHIQESLALVGLDGGGLMGEIGMSLQEGFRRYVACYEAQDHEGVLAVTESALVPRFAAWHESLTRVLGSHLGS